MASKDILTCKDRFRDITWTHLSKCIKVFEKGELLSASIWACVFVESILKDILGILLEQNFSDDDLGALLNAMSGMLKRGAAKIPLSPAETAALSDVMRRSDEIRQKRNRLVHDTGLENVSLDSDAFDIYKNIELIVDRYVSTSVSEIIRREKEAVAVPDQPKAVEPTFPMFLSTITPHTFEQSEFIESFCSRLRSIGIKPVRCLLTDFDRRKPMEKVRRYIKDCHGIIVLGLERSHSYYFKDKEGSEKESESVHRRYSSAWLQLETGMAVGMEKEVFVLCQKNLYSDGIFDRNWNSYTPVELDLPLNINDPKITEMLQVLEEFKNGIEKDH